MHNIIHKSTSYCYIVRSVSYNLVIPAAAVYVWKRKMVCIRQATVKDLLQMQNTNLWCLPENYQVRNWRLGLVLI
jgi:hypothetical protein